MWSAITAAVMVVLSLFIKPKTPKQKPQAFNSDAFPKCDDGTSKAIAFGQVKTKDFIVLYSGNFRTKAIKTKGSKKG